MAIQIAVWIQGLFSRIITIGRYGNWLTDINLLLILIRQMVALVRRALAEVCTLPVLLVIISTRKPPLQSRPHWLLLIYSFQFRSAFHAAPLRQPITDTASRHGRLWF